MCSMNKLLWLLILNVMVIAADDYIVRKDNQYDPYKSKGSGIGTFVDERDGHVYKTVKIGNQLWMAENLAYETSDSWCYDNKKSNCKKMGRIYKESILHHICPEKWKLPSKEDVETLIEGVGRNEVKYLLNAYYGGLAGVGDGEEGVWFTSDISFITSTTDDDNPYGPMPYVLSFDGDEAYIQSLNGNIIGYSVRCILDNSESGDIDELRKDQKFAKDIDKVLKDVAGLQTTGKTVLGGRRGKADGGSGGIGDGLAGMLSGGGDSIATKAKGSVKIPSESDIDIVSSSRSSADIMKAVRQRTPGLRHIYNKFLKHKPGFQGRVTLKFTIAPGGEVISISIASSTTGFSEFDGEIKTAVSRWKFGKVESGNTTVKIPFTFSE